MELIPFNRPYYCGSEIDNIRSAFSRGYLAGNGEFTRACEAWLSQRVGGAGTLLTHSCTAALEIASLLSNVGRGDEVIMPSYTFASTANAFVLRGAVPVFVDVRDDTLNINERLIEEAITSRTKAIVAVHYAGVPCAMDEINAIANKYGLAVIEDAAQALMSSYKGRLAGSLGDMAAFSFHETKNIISGEGGALVLRNRGMFERAEIIREKGTDRSRYFRGQVDRYTWQDVGSSFLPSEVISAFLMAQLTEADLIFSRRRAIWEKYHVALAELERAGQILRPTVPDHCNHNGHLYYVILQNSEACQRFITKMAAVGISCSSHYVPLHSSPFGLKNARFFGPLSVTDSIATRLVRLPIWIGVENHQDRIIDEVSKNLKQ